MKPNNRGRLALLTFQLTWISCYSFTLPGSTSIIISPSRRHSSIYGNAHEDHFRDSIEDEERTDIDGFPFHSSSLASVLKEIDISESSDTFIECGLREDQVKERQKIYGRNALPAPPRKDWTELFLQQFDDRLVQILLFVAGLSGVSSVSNIMSSSSMSQADLLESFIEPVIIFLILILNAAVGVWQQISALESMDALVKLQPRLATVLRYDDSQSRSAWISTFDAQYLVPGDVIKVKAGDMIPADVKIVSLESSVLGVDESCLTGESETVFKLPNMNNKSSSKVSKVQISEQNTIAFSGTTVTQGTAKALVLRTGLKTELGKIQSGVMSVQDTKTPLGMKLDTFGDDLAVIIAIICAAVWFTSIPRFNDPSFLSFFDGALYYAKVGVALGVAAIPE